MRKIIEVKVNGKWVEVARENCQETSLGYLNVKTGGLTQFFRPIEWREVEVDA